MNIHKVNMKYICIFKNSTVHLYNNERCLKNKKREKNRSEAVDRNGRFQIQGGKKLDFTEINHCKQILLGLSLAGNLIKPLLSL